MTADLRHFEVRPAVGTMRVEVTCRRCRGLVRHPGLSGLATIADVVAAAEEHEERRHRPQLVVAEAAA